MKVLDRLALAFVIIGGLHLLLAGLFDINIVQQVLTPLAHWLDEVFYGIVGVSSLWSMKYFNYTPKGGSRLKGR